MGSLLSILLGLFWLAVILGSVFMVLFAIYDKIAGGSQTDRSYGHMRELEAAEERLKSGTGSLTDVVKYNNRTELRRSFEETTGGAWQDWKSVGPPVDDLVPGTQSLDSKIAEAREALRRKHGFYPEDAPPGYDFFGEDD